MSLTRRRVGPGAGADSVGVLGALCEQLLTSELHRDSGVGRIGCRSVGVAERGWSKPGSGGMRDIGRGGRLESCVAGEPGKSGACAKAAGMWRPGRERCDEAMCGGDAGDIGS